MWVADLFDDDFSLLFLLLQLLQLHELVSLEDLLRSLSGSHDLALVVYELLAPLLNFFLLLLSSLLLHLSLFLCLFAQLHHVLYLFRLHFVPLLYFIFLELQ